MPRHLNKEIIDIGGCNLGECKTLRPLRPHTSHLLARHPAVVAGLNLDSRSLGAHAGHVLLGAVLTVLGLDLDRRQVLLRQPHSDALPQRPTQHQHQQQQHHGRRRRNVMWLGGQRAGLATRRSRVRFPAAAASTGLGDRLRARKPPQYVTKSSRPTQPPTFSGTGNEYHPKCGDAV